MGVLLSTELLSVFVKLELVFDVEFVLGGRGEDGGDHFGVRVENSVEGKTSSLDWVFVHVFIKTINNKRNINTIFI